jgi:5-methylcytosine-specific restriction endonuclease McrA
MKFCRKCNLYLKLSKDRLCSFCVEDPPIRCQRPGKVNLRIRGCEKYKIWRDIIRNRDIYCIICGSPGEHADHITPLSVLISTNKIQTLTAALSCEALWDPNNGRLLCKACHGNQPTTPASFQRFWRDK